VARVARVTPISVSYREPNDNHNTRFLTFCRIEADDGTTGWGEAITMFPGAARATERIVEEMRDLNVHRLFVVDENRVLVGVITALDVIRHLIVPGR
jgi:L-alanine-DL-glutamate epimerase-like enolase superfamily enzyme